MSSPLVGLIDGLCDSYNEYGGMLTQTVELCEPTSRYGLDVAWLKREGFLSETPTSHDTWMEAAGLLDN